jgi:hypothetical protein
LRPSWLDVLLVLAIVSLIGYVGTHDADAAGSPWRELWPNITVDLFSVWLVARIIEGILSSREKRRTAALQLRAALNYSMDRARSVLPDARLWAVQPVLDEARWMRMNAQRRDMHLESEAREVLLHAATDLEAIASVAEQLGEALVDVQTTRDAMRNKFEEANEADSRHPSLWDVDPLKELGQAIDLSRDLTTGRAATSVTAAISKASQAVAALTLAPPVEVAVRAYSDAADQALAHRVELQRMVDAYTDFVRAQEEAILARHRLSSAPEAVQGR